jgi:serine/threonine protein kinase/tetratricopeptide (TPR) repeat protein
MQMAKPGDKIKHYEILDQLGKGGMGEVYLALDTALDRKVAIKFLPEEMQKDSTARVRLLREAKAAAALDHPFICKIYETGEIDDKSYIAMEYVEGKDLREKLDEGLLPLRDSLQMALEIAEALEEAHGKGIVHRDLKPANIMLTPQGHVKVMDFGLAKQILPKGEEAITKTLTQASITEQGAIVGTLAYMSPEQAKGDTVDEKSDIFSLGILLYEMTSGIHPFSKESPIETLSSILRDPTPPVSVRPKVVNPVLTPILRRALAKDRASRYQKVSELVVDIRKLLRETVGGPRLLFRGWQLVAGAVLIIAMLITGAWVLFRRGPPSSQEPGSKTISVLVANFENQTGDAILDGVLEKAMDISLADASFIHIHNRQEALRLATELDPLAGETLNRELAQLVSRRAGVNVVVGGSIEEGDKGYTVKVWALDTVKSESVYEDSIEVGSKSEILKAADRVSAKLRSNLGDISADSVEALTEETFTTTSLEAMKAYALAQELDDQGLQEEALKEYQRAIDHDPNFGRAYSGAANILLNIGRYDEGEAYFEEALKRVDQMTDREKHRDLGLWALYKRDYKKAIDEYSALLKQYPGDYVIHANLAIAYFYARDMAKAVEEGRLDVKYNPQGVHAHNNLSWYALGAGDLETAEKESRKAMELEPGFEKAYITLALTQLAKSEVEQAAETYRQLKDLGSYGVTLAAAGLADLAVYEGRLAEAVETLKEGITFDLENKQGYDAAEKCIMLAHAYLLQEKKELASKAADRAIGIRDDAEIVFSAALVYLNAGQDDKARRLQAELFKLPQPEPRVYAKLIGGEMSRARGDIGNAVNLFHEAKDSIDTWNVHFFLGLAYLDAEDYTAAYSEFETCIKRGGEAASVFQNDIPSYRYLSPVYYYLGRAQEGLGSAGAAESYGKFLKIKEKDDGADSMVKDARSRLDYL